MVKIIGWQDLAIFSIKRLLLHESQLFWVNSLFLESLPTLCRIHGGFVLHISIPFVSHFKEYNATAVFPMTRNIQGLAREILRHNVSHDKEDYASVTQGILCNNFSHEKEDSAMARNIVSYSKEERSSSFFKGRQHEI